MIKRNWWLEVLVELVLVFLVINGVFALCDWGVRLPLIGAAFIVLLYEGWKVLDD